MLNSLKNKNDVFLTAIFGVLFGSFGLALSLFLPTVSSNIFFVISVPLICAVFLLAIISVKSMLVVLLFVRALLDPLLNVTKISIFGENIGAGGAINLLIIILAVYLITRNPKRLSKNNLFKSWVFFLFISGIAIIYSPVPGRAVKLFFNLLSYMSMAIIPFFIIHKVNDKKFWLNVLIFSSILPVCFANFDLLKGGSYYLYEGMRIKGSFMHPNILAFYLILIIAISFYMLKSNLFTLTTAKKNLLRIYLVNLLVLIIATKTRNAWISCWALFFIYGLLKEKKYLLFSALLPFLLLLHPFIVSRARDLFTDTAFGVDGRLNSLAWRLELWESSLPLIKNKFIFGHGLASFRSLSYSFFSANLLSRQSVASHNTYLGLLFEMGIMGFASYMMIFLIILKAFFSKVRKAATHLSAGYALVLSYLVSYMIVCFGDNLLYYLVVNWYFWFFIGIILRGIELDDRKQDIGNNSVF